MKQLYTRNEFVTTDKTQQEQPRELRQNLGEVFVAALADPATIGMLLSSDGTLWQERFGEAEPWRRIEKLTTIHCEAILRTVTAIASDRRLEVEVRLDGSRIVGQPVGLNCACCRPRPLQAAPKPLFRLCWRKVSMIRACLKNAQREHVARS